MTFTVKIGEKLLKQQLRAINAHTKILHDNRATLYINEKYIKS